MILDSDNNILESTNAELYQPKRKPISEIDSYISDLSNMTFREWIDNVPYSVFEKFVLHYIEIIQEMNGRIGEYLPAIRFSDHILNFTITALNSLNSWPYGNESNPEISIDFVLCDKGLRDSCHRKDLMIEQMKYYNTHRINKWSIFLDKYTIVKFMYDFMKDVKDDIIFQKYTWNF